jgi:hypothetical protein
MSESLNLLYAPGESIFGVAAPAMLERGWSVFPQERTGQRRPGRSNGKMIAWGGLSEKKVSPEELKDWIRDCSTLNVAAAMGPASGHSFAVDIDCLDPNLSKAVQDTAFRILGRTPFVRIGRAPKVALIYRHAPETTVRNSSWKFTDESGENSGEDGLEILAKGKPLTFHGLHHVTGRYFMWPDSSPLTLGPEHAPLVDNAALTRFIEEVARIRPFFKGREASEVWSLSSDDWGDTEGLRVPILRSFPGYPTDEEGRITDMRERHLASLVFHIVTGNKVSILEVARDDDAFKALCGKLARAVVDVFRETAVVDRKWESRLKREPLDKVRRLAQKVRDNPQDYAGLRKSDRGEGAQFRVLPSHMGETARERVGKTKEAAPVVGIDETLGWMRASPRIPVRGWHEPAGDDSGGGWPIRQDRDRVGQEIGEALERAFDEFLNECFDEKRKGPGRLHITDAPTGAGKTSRMLRRLATDPRIYTHEGKPFIMLLPTYHNIDELRGRAHILNLDPNLPDAELTKAAQELGVMSEEDAFKRIEELRRDAADSARIARMNNSVIGEFRTSIYAGKVRAGCRYPEKVELAMAAGVGASAFCRAVVMEKNGSSREEFCPHYETCPAIHQKTNALSSHVVFMPHPFLALKIPEELEDVRGIIADERIHHLFLHVAELHVSTLKSPRRPPRLTAIEREEGLDPQEILAERNEAVNIALSALSRGQCPAEALDALPARRGEIRPGLALVQSALRVCGDGVRRDGQLSPSTSFEEVRDWCARPVGREIREELKFWQIIAERMSALLKDRELTPEQWAERTRDELSALPDTAPAFERLRLERRIERLQRLGRFARGSREMRIQKVEDGEGDARIEKIRLSWRTTPNWAGIPTMLLDASAAPEVVAKIWEIPIERVVVHRATNDYGTVLNVRTVAVPTCTFSNAHLMGSPDGAVEERIQAAHRLQKVRDAIAAICMTHANGRVVAGASILVREAICEGWTPPINLDWCHYGAMRGLDAFKFHAAAVSVGRMEIPVRAVDGLVAALSYDDFEPELPFDTYGTGRDEGDKPLRIPVHSRGLRMRDGSKVWLEVPCYPGRWAALMQRQYREEELLQFVGRLRPVYRQGEAPVWYALTSVIPEGIIIDDVLDIEDLLGGVKGGTVLWNIARRTGGILEPALAEHMLPDLAGGAEEVERLLALNGFNVRTGAWREGKPPVAWKNWDIHLIRRGDDSIHGHALVMSCVEKSNVALEEAMRRIIRKPSIEKIRGADEVRHFLSMAIPRKPDSIDDRLGTAADREGKEKSLLKDFGMEVLLGKASINPATGMMEFMYDGKPASMTVQERLALVAQGRAWKRKLSPKTIQANHLREGDESPSWENMAIL